MSARAREFFGLVPVSILVTAGFTAVLITRSDEVQAVTVTYGLVFLGCCLLAHLFIRARLPQADPYLFPLAALLAAFGLVTIYRIHEDLARQQAQWFIFGLLLFAGTILFLRDYRVLERYRYTIAAIGIALLVAPRLPGIGVLQNGAYLALDVGIVQFQPAEFAKLAIIIFLASYLADNREVMMGGRVEPPPITRSIPILLAFAAIAAGLILVAGTRVWPTVLGALFAGSLALLIRERPSPKHIGPLLLVWGVAMVMLVVIRDLGSSLMFFGGFLALLYVATSRLSFVAFGMSLFAAGATVFVNSVSHVQDRVATWLDVFRQDFNDDKGYQIAQSLFAQADGGLFGRGLGNSILFPPGTDLSACEPVTDCAILPAPHTDTIYALITNDMGLFAAAAVLLVYLLFAARGFKTALLATDDFSKLLAAGLTAVFALQVFVIVGGVTGAIPLTGVTLPFVSYGGSSLMANFILLALLLMISDSARRDAQAKGLA
jgi:cell division protein FtsW (lipid II flippase)